MSGAALCRRCCQGLPVHPAGSQQVDAGTAYNPDKPGYEWAARACWLTDPAEPYALTLRLRSVTRWVNWCVARELVAEGAEHAAGQGDVRLELLRDINGDEDLDRLLIELCSPAGRMVLLADAQSARTALGLSYETVPELDEDWLVSVAVNELLADFERGARQHQAWVLEQIGDLTGLGHGTPRRYTPVQVLAATRNLIEQLRAGRYGYLDEARARHLQADRYWGQLLDLCSHEGIDPGEDPHAALLAHLRGPDWHDHPAGQPCNGFCGGPS
ncbi:MAG: SsgA family sporulation/cell division regulator [Pseudonocardiaceae bacterium]|nr:SsgA family sporulation/cell division regulator [Pseudonocardiaceae bacterium]